MSYGGMLPGRGDPPRRPGPGLQQWLLLWLVSVLAVILIPEVADYSGPEVIAFALDAMRVSAQAAVFATIAFVIWRSMT